jgi:hypothetical protein
MRASSSDRWGHRKSSHPARLLVLVCLVGSVVLAGAMFVRGYDIYWLMLMPPGGVLLGATLSWVIARKW